MKRFRGQEKFLANNLSVAIVEVTPQQYGTNTKQKRPLVGNCCSVFEAARLGRPGKPATRSTLDKMHSDQSFVVPLRYMRFFVLHFGVDRPSPHVRRPAIPSLQNHKSCQIHLCCIQMKVCIQRYTCFPKI
jgi:hypothetical protein